jgi:hypothetical protein
VKKAVEFEVERQTAILEEGKTPVQETRGFDEKKNNTYSQRSKEEAHDYRYFPEPDIPPMNFSDEYLSAIQKKLPELPSKKVERYLSDSNDYWKARSNVLHYFEVIQRPNSQNHIFYYLLLHNFNLLFFFYHCKFLRKNSPEGELFLNITRKLSFFTGYIYHPVDAKFIGKHSKHISPRSFF